MISVIIPLYNKGDEVGNTLDSVFCQTFQEFEIIIVDDGSTDNSLHVISSFSDPRIRIIQQQNQGVSAARNKGVLEAKFEFVAFLDADDEWELHHLEHRVELIKKFPLCSVFASAYKFRKYDKVESHIVLNKLSISGKDGVLDNYFDVAASSHPPLWTSSVVVRKSALLDVGGFPVGVIAGEDLLTWAKLATKFQIAYSLEVTAVFIVDDRHDLKNTPPRIPASDDVVGRGLESLYRENKTLLGLRRYVALWYKMRSAVFLRLGDTRSALREIKKSLRFNPCSLYVWVYLFLCFCPVSLRRYVFEKFSK